MELSVHGWNCPYVELSMGGIVHRWNFLLVEFSVGGIFHWNFPGEIFLGEIFLGIGHSKNCMNIDASRITY